MQCGALDRRAKANFAAEDAHARARAALGTRTAPKALFACTRLFCSCNHNPHALVPVLATTSIAQGNKAQGAAAAADAPSAAHRLNQT